MVAKPINNLLNKHIDKIIIGLYPILLIFLNRNWVFTPPTDFLPDAWFYFAYFRYFFAYAPVFPSNIHYFVERLTWNIPGYFIYHILPPLQANYVLHLIVYYTALFSLYGILFKLFNRRSAILTALFLGSYPWFLRAVGWDYVDGIGIALMLLLLYILTVASHSPKWRLFPFLAGIIHASLIITNLFWLGFIPGWIAYFLIINYRISKLNAWKLLGKAIYFILGNLALIIMAGIFYHSVTGTYVFFKNSVAFLIQNLHNIDDINFAKALYGQMPPYWHIISLLIAIGVMSRLRKNTQDIYRYSFLAITVLFVLAYCWLIFGNFFGWPYLVIFLYSSFVIPSVFLLLGALLIHAFDYFTDKQFSVLIVAAILIFAAPFLLVVILPFLEYWQGNIFLIVFFSSIFLVSIYLSNIKAFALPLFISFSILSFLVGKNAYVYLPNILKGQNNFTALIDSSKVIDSYFPNHAYTDFRFWFREDENFDSFFDLSALYLYPWGRTIGNPLAGNKPAPDLSFPSTDPIHNGDNIVIMSSNSKATDIIAEADHALAYRNAVITMQASKEIKEGPLIFTIYFTEIKSLDTNNSILSSQ